MNQMFEITQKAKVLVMFANTYDMQDEQGRSLSGCSVHYYFWGENGEPLMTQTEWDPNKPIGYQRAKVSMDKELRVKMPIVPAIYEGTFKQVVGGDGKPVLKMIDVAYVSNVEFNACINPGLVVPGMVQPAAAPAETAAGGGKVK